MDDLFRAGLRLSEQFPVSFARRQKIYAAATWGRSEVSPLRRPPIKARMWVPAVCKNSNTGQNANLVPCLACPSEDAEQFSKTVSPSAKTGLSSDTKSTPRRFDLGKVVQDLIECCHAIVFASLGRRK
jgi:hypothetical protein